ncbi:hypothetical protein LRP31_23630 [Mesorhizobium mediterraneum]|uniref:Uncharacterized protein n=1 Tax=Mesorhizobium mediterraneum TaxID=43617 RepID=A0AB36QZU9_9HYPH|nr:hypothetical protein [Mesorhizobium mediterraneum]PAP97806.1 hypothetical protein CIT25_35050 [Mesorhizobium mediterraneum]WIW52037.1 hypothetical protein LRP31_23630 [Mesorhizobium mediterraneum]
MTNADEFARLYLQAEGARARLDALLSQREAAQQGGGLSPKPSEIDKARDRLEAAERLLEAHGRMAVRV